MILLWGLAEDNPLAAVRDALAENDISYAFLDQRAALDTAVELRVDTGVEAVVRAPGLTLDLHAVTAAYLRPHDSRHLPEVELAGLYSPAWNHVSQVEDILLSWSELTPALVINRPSAMATNGSKPYQAAIIRAHGFNIPNTLITTDPRAAAEFWEAQGSVVYKSISGVRSIVSRVTLEHRERLPFVSWCPTQFQKYIPGTDYRVHIVGTRVFACEVICEADDYRYAARQGSSVDIRACEIPEKIVTQCKLLAADLQLTVAGVDLRQTPNGDWYCFEVNPSPGFSYYAEICKQPIAEAIAQLLASQPKAARAAGFATLPDDARQQPGARIPTYDYKH